MLFFDYGEHHHTRFGMALNTLIKRSWTAQIYHYRVVDAIFLERLDLTIAEKAIIHLRTTSFEVGSLISPSMPLWKRDIITPKDLFTSSLDMMTASNELSERDKKLLTKSIIDGPSTVTIERARLLPSDIIDKIIQWKMVGCVVHKAPTTKLGAS